MNLSKQMLTTLAAAAIIALPAAKAPAAGHGVVSVDVLKDNAQGTVLNYQFDDFDQQKVLIDGQAYTSIHLGSESLMKDRGAPALPDVSRSIIIPDAGVASLNILDSRYYEIKDIAVAPSKGIILRDVNPDDVPYVFGGSYETDAFYPGGLASLRAPHILRDHRGVVVTVNPFQYNPVQRVLRVYTEMKIEVNTEGRGGVNVLKRLGPNRSLCRSFHTIYESHFLNYNLDGRYDPLDEEGDMLIICHDDWMSNVMPLADHKTSIGINATVVGVSTIGNNYTSIKDYIQDVYDTSDLAFVLLVGDDEQVKSYQVSGSASDPTYSKLAGNDDYPDIMIGRFSAQNSSQVDTQVERTIEYENMPATEQDWFWKGTGVASNQGPGDDNEYDDEHEDNLRLLLLAYGYTEVDQIYDPYGTDTMVTNALNEGRGIVNYTGHGSPTSWGSTGFNVTDVNNLANDNILPFITSVACNNGQFDDYDPCFGEAWLRATHNGEPSGAVGFYGSSISQSWDPPMQMQDEYIDLYTAEAYVCYGTLCFAGSCSMMDQYGSSGVNEFNYWTIFGDPSLRVVGTAAPPTGMKVSPTGGLASEGPNGGPFTPDSITYTLTNHDPTPIQYSVSKTAAWIDLSDTGGTIPVGGTAEVIVSINSSANGMDNGFYEDLAEFVNLTNHDGDTTRRVMLEVGVPVPVIVFDLSTNPGWSTEGNWAFGQPTGGGGEYGGPDPNSGYTGNNVYGYNLNGDYENDMSERHLTTTAIDCSELTQVQLKFWRWLGVETSYYDHAYVRVSTNGADWTTIWQNSDYVEDSSWSQQAYDISAIADGQSTVYIRWTMGTTDGSWRYCGWNIDDIEIWGVEPSAPCPWDVNGDNVVDIDDLFDVLAHWNEGAGQYDVNNDGIVDIDDVFDVLGHWGDC